MKLFLERPYDRLITERAHVLSGRVEGADEPFALGASCHGKIINLRRRVNSEQSSHVVRFWTYLFLQEHLPLENGHATIDFTWNAQPLETARLRVSTAAIEIARNYPLNLGLYAVDGSASSSGPPVHTIVFPGLGAVGGTSLSHLMRFMMHRWDVTVLVDNEPDNPGLWRELVRRGLPDLRWIDGHYCYQTAADLTRSFARITLLREPLKRMVSIFNYCTIVHPTQFRHATLKDFVTSDEALGFTQAASLLRCSGSTPQPDRDDQLYSLASKELAEGYSLVGITELFEETIFAICRLAGYREIAMWWPILAAPQTSSVADLSHAESEKLRRLLAVDFQLYEDARARFVKTCEALDLSGCCARYKEDAAKQSRLPDHHKMLECARWRQVLADEEAGQCRAQDVKSWADKMPESADVQPCQ